ncbi:G-protein coupled receptor 98-like [Lingula anatina]|uniref:G-protein coupled receptor 98-like n=1 Tax=Lingula anatina TaxID=7574 RepID=A0A1S3JBC2_LINAN|nr:G-protein coupled receptor 98-like [Lingula anatina]XP_013407179.1 G-protein coupled receptor 98-like [Lingula anatina]|eukprot:XP_013407178.1 G-protein coupled receptor 98-like [Lingula anatina]
MTVHPSLLTVLLLSLLCPSVGQQQKAVIKFVQTSYVVDEGQQVSIEVSKTGFSAPPLNVVVMVVMLSDQNGSNDFVGNSQALTFPNNSYNITRSVSFFVLDDDIPERDEVFTLQLLLSTNSSEKAMKGDPSEATITVRANDDAFGIFAFAEPSPYTVSEGPSSVQVPLTIQRNRGTFGNISVNFDLSGSALVSEDITPVSGTLLFLEGESSKDLILTILGDNIPENDETFVVTLTSATGGASINLTQDRLQLVIPANDAPVRFTQGEYRVEETAMSIDLSVTITRGLTEDGQTFIGPITKDAYVYVTCISGSATAGQDFSCASNTSLVFQAGETSKSFTIQILPDDAAEIAEEFYIVLFNPSSDVVVSDPYNVSVIIGANDETHGVLSLKSPSATSFPQTYVNEDTTSQLTFFTVIRSGGAFGTVSVDWILSRNDSNPDSAATDVTPCIWNCSVE